MNNELSIAEIFHDSGEIRFRYSRYMSADGMKWIRHGLFRAYHKNGALASEGSYTDGVEEGMWRDFHENGKLAAQGLYAGGLESGTWKYWDESGQEQS